MGYIHRTDCHCKGTSLGEQTEIRDSFSLAESRLADFGIQTVRLMCYRGSLSDIKWVDQDPCELFSFYSLHLVLMWSISAAFSTFCIIRADLSKATKDLITKNAGGRVYYQLDYDVIILLGLTEPQAYLGWKTRVSCWSC